MVGKTSVSRMKKLKKKNPAEEIEFDSDADKDWVHFPKSSGWNNDQF